MGGSLVGRLADASDSLLQRLADGEARRRVEVVRDRLHEPLRVAVGGRLKAGKSTLVNALLGQRIAATEVGECTKVVAWYRYGVQDKIEVRPRNGRSWTLPRPLDGRLPDDIGASAPDIDSITVWMSSRRRLGDLTLIDTPGLFSLNDQYSAQTTRSLGLETPVDSDSRQAVSVADALVYVMPHPGDQDRQFLDAFQALYPDGQTSAANVVGVLSKIDVLGSGRGDPWPQARRIAANYERKLRASVACIVPVAGLLAETAAGSDFTEADVRDLGRLSQLDAVARAGLLESADAFLTAGDAGLDADRRATLLGFLGLYGVREALGFLDSGRCSAGALLAALRRTSGVDELHRVIEEKLTARADTLKAHRALGALLDICFSVTEPDEQHVLNGFRAELERIQLDPAMHAIREIDLLRTLDSRAVVLPEELESEAVRVAKGITPAAKLGLNDSDDAATLSAAARERAMVWKRYENDPETTPRQARAAGVVRESLEHIYFAGPP